MKRKAVTAFLALVVLSLTCSVVLAEPPAKEADKARLKELRQKKVEMRDQYDAAVEAVNKASDERMAVIKTDFRNAREACLEDKHNKTEGLRKDFESRLRPVLKDEQELVALIGREAGEDFAKTKADKARSRMK